MTVKSLSISMLWLLVMIICACTAGPAGIPPRHVRWSVAVFDYENLSPLDDAHGDLSELLAAKAIETIEDMDRYDVVERQRLELVLEELNIGTSMVADRQTQLKLGDITGARLMVFGSYQIFDNRLRLDIRLVDVESGRVINAVSHMAEESNLPGWLDTSAKAMIALLGH